MVGTVGLGLLAWAGERYGVYDPPFGITLLTLAAISIGAAVLWRATHVIRRTERAQVPEQLRTIHARHRREFRWLDRIHEALDHNLLMLQAQPIVHVATDRVTQVEVLVRMRDGKELITPDRFLDIAEKHGLGPSIDRWVIRESAALAAMLTEPDDPRIEVNLSADSLRDPDLPWYIADLLGEHDVPPERMVFEVTETAAIANIDTARAFVQQLADLGCRASSSSI